jgi:hypothetical protein
VGGARRTEAGVYLVETRKVFSSSRVRAAIMNSLRRVPSGFRADNTLGARALDVFKRCAGPVEWQAYRLIGTG